MFDFKLKVENEKKSIFFYLLRTICPDMRKEILYLFGFKENELAHFAVFTCNVTSLGCYREKSTDPEVFSILLYTFAKNAFNFGSSYYQVFMTIII